MQLLVVAEVVTLSAFAITQPLYSLLGENATFFVAHSVTGFGLVFFAIALLLLPAAGFLLIDGAGWMIGTRAGETTHSAVLGSLLALAVMPPLLRSIGVGGWPSLVAWLLAAAAAAYMFQGVQVARTVVRWASFAPALFLLAFLFVSPASDLLSTDDPEPAQPLDGVDDSVVVLVFDQLPLPMLLDETGAIDAQRFPGFARLAAESTWFPNTTALTARTDVSVPSLLTGNVPEWGQLPVYSQHPENLFTYLAPTHEIYADEYVTQLCPDDVCTDRASEPPSTVWKDTATVATRSLLAEDLADRFVPRIDGRWSNFAGETAVANEATDADEIIELRRQEADDDVRYEAFLESIGSTTGPSLSYLHLFQPHEPLRYLPDGQRYEGGGPYATEDGVWPDDQAMMDQRLQAYLAQTMHADLLVSRLLDRLEETGGADDTAIVVTSDHGVANTPGETNKVAEPDTDPAILTDLLRVPLFIKVPGSTPVVSETSLQLPDVLPTLFDLLDADTTELDFDGVPASGDPSQRPGPVLVTEEGPVVAPPFPEAAASPTINRLWSLMPDPTSPFAFGPVSDLVGQPPPPSAPASDGAPVASLTMKAELEGASGEMNEPVLVHGTLTGPTSSSDVAAVMNGTVAGGGRTFEADGQWWFSILVDPTYVNTGSNELSLLTLGADGPQRVEIL